MVDLSSGGNLAGEHGERGASERLDGEGGTAYSSWRDLQVCGMMIAAFLDVEINGLHPGLHMFGLTWILLASGKRR